MHIYMKKTTAKTRMHKCGKKSHLHRNYKCTRRTSIKNLINDLKISRLNIHGHLNEI